MPAHMACRPGRLQGRGDGLPDCEGGRAAPAALRFSQPAAAVVRDATPGRDVCRGGELPGFSGACGAGGVVLFRLSPRRGACLGIASLLLRPEDIVTDIVTTSPWRTTGRCFAVSRGPSGPIPAILDRWIHTTRPFTGLRAGHGELRDVQGKGNVAPMTGAQGHRGSRRDRDCHMPALDAIGVSAALPCFSLCASPSPCCCFS